MCQVYPSYNKLSHCYVVCSVSRENGLEDKVKLVKGRMEDVDLPVEKVLFVSYTISCIV